MIVAIYGVICFWVGIAVGWFGMKWIWSEGRVDKVKNFQEGDIKYGRKHM